AYCPCGSIKDIDINEYRRKICCIIVLSIVLDTCLSNRNDWI
ncbi:peroxiredoxin, putative, partial [Entamoeba nuttalli P19]